MKKNLRNIAVWIHKRLTRKPVMTCLLAGVFIVGILLPNVAFAADTSSAMDEALLKIQESVNIAFGVVHALFWPILLIIGSLMDNDLIFGPQIGDKLREIWVVMRNIVNIVFVFILLIIAFYNVTGFGGEGNFALKTVLPKFVIALIAVNFSFLACKVILDAANVVSVAVYDLSSAVNGDVDIAAEMAEQACTNPAYLSCMEEGGTPKAGDTDQSSALAAAEAATIGGGEAEATALATLEASITQCTSGSKSYSKTWNYSSGGIVPKAFCCNTDDLESGETQDTACESNLATTYPPASSTGTIFPALNSFGQEFFKTTDQNNIGIIMAINLGSLQKLTQSAGSEGVTLKDLTMNTLIATIMYIVFGLAYVALFCVLLARLVVLWLVIALSPIIALTTVMPQIAQYTSELKLGEKFVQHVTAPIVIGLSMSIGYIMVSKLQEGGSTGIDLGGAGNTSFSDFTSGDATGKFLTSNISDLHQLMIAAIAVAIVWLGVFGAADKTLANSITNKIKDAGTSAAKFIAGLPKFIPMVPIMTRGKQVDPYSFSDITNIANKFKNLPEVRSQQRVDKFMTDSGLGDLFRNSGMSAPFESGLRDYQSDKGNKFKQAEKLKILLDGKINNETDYKELKALLEEMGVKDLPSSMSEFERKWKNNNEFRKEISTAYGRDNDYFKKEDYKPGTETKAEESTDTGTTTDATKTPQQNFVTIVGGKKEDNPTNIPQTKVDAAKPYIATTGVTAQPNDENIKQLIAANPQQSQLKTTPDGKIDVIASLKALGITPTPATPPADPAPTPPPPAP